MAENTNGRPDMTIDEQGDGSVLITDLLDLGRPDTTTPPAEKADGGQVDGDQGHDDADADAARADGADGGGGEADERVTDQTLTDPEREAVRERRRQERANKKAAQREREHGYKQELVVRDRVIQELSERLLQIEQRGVANDVAQLDTAMRRAGQAVEYFKGVIAEATTKQDGTTVADATFRMQQAQSEADRLAHAKNSFVAAAQRSGQPVMDPSVRSNTEAWMGRNRWYDPSGKDEDSAIVLSIDARLAREGYDPKTPAYWSEMDRRVAKYLPHRKEAAYSGDQSSSPGRQNRTPVAGSGREGAGAGQGSAAASGQYRLSAARVQALKDAGQWDDPKARNDAIRRYRDYDKQHAQRS
jgi:hypothetical protein